MDWWWLSVYTVVDVEEGLFSDPMGRIISKDEMTLMGNPTLVEEMFKLAGMLQKLKLDGSHIGLLKALCLLSAGEWFYYIFLI